MSDPISSPEVLRREALRLSSAPPSRENLVAFVSWLDAAIVAAAEHPETLALLRQILALSCLAQADLLYEQQLIHDSHKTVGDTCRDLEHFLLDPTEARWDAVFHSASQSYPFGPGEGCYKPDERKTLNCGDPGSGCSSGAGTLACSGLPDANLLVAIQKALQHWLS